MQRLARALLNHDRRIGSTIIGAMTVFMLYWAFAMEWTAGGGDTFSHFLIARFSWVHPSLLLDLWGKPIFTLLAAPWTLAGMKGVEVYNTLLFLAVCAVVWQICRLHHMRLSFTALFAVGFAPVFFIHTFSALTEHTFALILCGGLLLSLRQKHLAAALLWSLLPLSRSEGFVLMPVLALWMLWNRQYIHWIWLGAGTLIYSFIGSWVFGDLLWLWHQNPYHPDNTVYGQGTWSHFFDSYQHITHMCIGLLFIAGTLRALFSDWQGDKAARTVLFCLAIVFVFTLFHASIWALGLGSMGIVRVFAAITPLMAVAVVFALDGLWHRLTARPWLAFILTLGFLIWMTILPFTKYKLPMEIHTEEKAMRDFTSQLKSEGWQPLHLYFYDPITLYLLGRDPWDYAINYNGLTTSKHKLETLESGDWIIWDAHYGPSEGHTPGSYFENNANFTLVKVMNTDFRTMNDRPYSIRLYRRN